MKLKKIIRPNVVIDPKLQKKFNKWLKKQEEKPSLQELKEIKKLEKQALSLWRKKVKINAKGKCEVPLCKKIKRLNAHHIESFALNKYLRYDPRNGVGFCPTHHKFGRQSAHKSFCFMYEFMAKNRPDDLEYLLDNYLYKTEITKEFLEETIKNLS